MTIRNPHAISRLAKRQAEVRQPDSASGDVQGTARADRESLSLDAEWPDVADYVRATTAHLEPANG